MVGDRIVGQGLCAFHGSTTLMQGSTWRPEMGELSETSGRVVVG